MFEELAALHQLSKKIMFKKNMNLFILLLYGVYDLYYLYTEYKNLQAGKPILTYTFLHTPGRL